MANLTRCSTIIYRIILSLSIAALLAGCAYPAGAKIAAGAITGEAQGSQQALLKSPRGVVEVQSGGTWSPLPTSGEPVFLESGQRVRTGNLSSAQISFADGSLVSLEANSELAIDELSAGAPGKPRLITLTQVSGKSQHKVAVSSDENSHYEVHTPGGAATAKGTLFTVWVLPDQASLFSVVEGVVVVVSAQVTVTVNAGQVTTFPLNQPPSPPQAHLEGEGTVTQVGEKWTIAGLDFQLKTDTIQIGDIHPGDVVHFEGRQLEDGSRVLDLVVLIQPSLANTFRLQGPAEKITETTWTVNGQTISLAPQTWIEPEIAEGDLVIVEGLILPNGVFLASRILKAAEEGGQPFEFVGPVQVMEPERWVVAGVELSVNSQTLIGNGIEVGKLVKASGRIQPDGTWLAETISLAGENERQFEISGEIQNMTPWEVAGITFETRPWTQIDPDLKLGDRVRVSGSIDTDGKWIAAEIRRIANPETHLILIGPLLSLDPLVVSGVSFKTTPQTVFVGSFTVGMLVRVEARLLEDGTWEALRVEPLQLFVWVPTCMDLNLILVSIQGNLVQFQGWPQMTLPPDFKLSGQLVPNSVVVVRVCISATFIIEIITITISPVPTSTQEPETGKVLICHKPGKKGGGKTMLLPRSALGGHLGHGDYLGACH